jgi:hypothetical protein
LLPLENTIGVAEPAMAGDDRIDAAMVEGRRADQGRSDELVVNEAMRDALHAEIGDRFSLVSVTPEQVRTGGQAGHSPSPAGPTQDVTLVGVARAAEDVSDAPEPVLYVTTAYYERHGRAIVRREGVGLRVDEDHLLANDDKPSNVDNLDELGGLPAVLASFLAVLAVIAVAHALVSTPGGGATISRFCACSASWAPGCAARCAGRRSSLSLCGLSARHPARSRRRTGAARPSPPDQVRGRPHWRDGPDSPTL